MSRPQAEEAILRANIAIRPTPSSTEQSAPPGAGGGLCPFPFVTAAEAERPPRPRRGPAGEVRPPPAPRSRRRFPSRRDPERQHRRGPCPRATRGQRRWERRNLRSTHEGRASHGHARRHSASAPTRTHQRAHGSSCGPRCCGTCPLSSKERDRILLHPNPTFRSRMERKGVEHESDRLPAGVDRHAGA